MTYLKLFAVLGTSLLPIGNLCSHQIFYWQRKFYTAPFREVCFLVAHYTSGDSVLSRVFGDANEVPIHNSLAVLFSSRALSVFTVKLDVSLTHGVAEATVLAPRCLACPLVSWDPHLSQLCTLLLLCIVLHVQCYFSFFAIL